MPTLFKALWKQFKITYLGESSQPRDGMWVFCISRQPSGKPHLSRGNLNKEVNWGKLEITRNWVYLAIAEEIQFKKHKRQQAAGLSGEGWRWAVSVSEEHKEGASSHSPSSKFIDLRMARDAGTFLDQNKGFVFSRMALFILFVCWLIFVSPLSTNWKEDRTLFYFAHYYFLGECLAHNKSSVISFWTNIKVTGGFPHSPSGKEPVCQCRRRKRCRLITGLGRLKDWRTHSRILAWRIPLDRGACRLQFIE